MAQDPTRVSPGDYSATAYDVLSKYDPAFPDNVSVEAFFDNLQSPEYAAKAYALLADADPELVNNLSIDDFIGNVKKKEEPVVTESVSGDGSSEQLPSTEIPEGALERKVNQFGQEVDELGVVLPQSDSPFELTDYRNRRKQATSQQDTAAIRLADQIQVEELERLEEERKIAAASMPAVPALEGREAPDYVAQLRQMYGPYGVRFETSTALGLGEFGSIKAYAVGADGNAVEHNIDIVDGKVVEAQLGGLNEFLQSNSRAKGGVEVDKRSLSEKALKVQEMRPVARRNEDGDQSTVKMEDAEYDGRFFSYPTLFPIGDGFSANPNDWMELDGVAAFDEAQRRGELFEFDTAEEANRFAKGEWKEIRETDAIAEQMWAEKGRNYYADETFLRRVEEAKKEYEFLESLVPGEQLFTGRMSDRYLDETEIPPAYQKYLTTYTDERGEKKLIARADIEEVREQKERELAALEQQFDNDNELLRLKEDYDEYLGQKRGEVMERAATLNQEGKVIQNRADVASINRFGVPVKGLLSMQPETEAEYNEMLGLLTQYNTGIEQRQVAALQYEKNKLYYDAQHEKLINQEYVDGFEEVWVKAKNGWSRGKAMSRLLLIHYGYYDAIGDEKAEEEAMREVSAIMDSMDTRVGRATSRTNMTGTTESFLERINPMDSGLDAATYTAALTAESLGQLLPIWFRILPVAAGAGAVYGAAGGPLGATFGVATTTLGAAGMGALAAVTTVGMPVSELALEMGNAILEVGERKGYDWADPNSALLALNDESVWKEGADRGYKRGIPIALTGMVSNMVMAKAALGGSRVLPLAERIALGVGTGVTVEPASEMLGEYLAIKATGEYTGSTANVKEIAAEGLGAIGMGVGFTTSLAALGYAKDVVTDANFDLALRLMDPDGISKENVRGERIVSWANRMERLGKIDAEQAEAIRKNVGRRRQANELLGKRVDSRPGSDSQVIGRIVELLEAKEELERSGPNVFGEKIRAITEEIALIAESGKVEKPGGAAVNLSDIRGRIRNRRAGAYKFNGKNVSRQDFLSKLQEATPRQLKRARAYNDIEAQRKLAKRRQDNAISKREAAEVPVGKRAGFGTEVDEEVREITQEVINDQAEGKLDEDQIETLLAPLAAKKARGEKLTDLEQQFAETNSSLLKRVEKDLKDLDKLVGDPNAQEQEGITIIGKLTDRGKVVGKQARKAAKALRAAFPEVKIILHSDDASFVEAAKKSGARGTGRAFYGFDSKEIHVHTGRAKATTVAHEAFHAALRNSIDASDVQALMGDFVTALKKVIPADSDLAAKLDDFAQGYSEGRVDEEYVAEFFGELAAAYPTLDRKGKSVIARFLERLSKLINIDLTLPSDLTQRDEQILSLLETLAGKVARGKAIKGKQVSQFQELVSSSDTRGAAEQRAQTEDNLRAAEQRADDFSDEQIQAMADEGVIFHFGPVDITKVIPEKLKRFGLGYGFYFTNYALEDSVFRSLGERVTMADSKELNMLDGDPDITEEQAKALRDAAKTELQEAEEYGDDLGFEESQVLMSISETRAGEKWYPYFTSSLNDSRKVESELTDEQKATATRLVQEVLGFDGVAYGSDQTNTGAVSSVWNFGKLNRAIIEPGQEPRAAEQRVEQPFTTAAEQRTELSQSEINERNARVPESRNMPYKDVPSRMYHVTFAGEAIRKAGKLLASSGLGTGGIGGTESVGVSFYDNASDAEVLRNELDLISQANAIETEEEAQAFIDRLQESKGRSFQENYNLRRRVDDKVSDSLREVLRLERMRVNGPVIFREKTLPANQSPEIIEASKEDIPESTRILRGVDKNEVRVLSNVTVRERGASREAPRAAEQRVETNEDGSPKTFYHGTDATFEEFTPTEGVRTILASQIPVTSPAFFFTEDEAVAREYGKNVIPVNLSFSKLVHENIPEAVQIIKEVFPDGIEYSNGVIDYDDYTFEKNWIGKVLDSEEGIDWMLLDVPGFVDALKAAGFDGTLVYEGDEETSMAAFDNSNIQRLDREPRAAEQRVDVDEVRMRSRAGSRISKGLATYSVKGEKQVEEIENLTREYVKEQAPKAYIKNANILAKYPLVRGVREFGDITTVEQADEVYDIYTQQTLDNLRWMMETYPDEFSEISTLWYDGANKIANEMATRFGVTPEQAAGILASLSPQKDWYQNVRLAELLLEAFEDNPVMTREMIVYQKKKTAEVIKEKKKELKKARAKKGTSRARAKVEKFNKDKARLLNDIEVAEALLDAITALEGTRMMDADPSMMGYFVRLHSEETKPPQYQVISPDGEMVGPAKKDDGSTAKWAWGSYNEIGKGVSVMLNGSQENITASLGQQHKVRNFYNNIIDPMSTEGDVTMDTHAIAVSLLKPLSTKSDEVNHNFGGKGASSSGAKGIKGTYYANQEAYQILAEEMGLLPRQVQSVTWEAVRGLFTDKFKGNKENVKAINQIWENYADGKITIDEARAQVLERAGGVNPPVWAESVQRESGDGVREGRERGAGREGGRAAEQRVDVEAEGPNIVYRSGAVDSKAESRGRMDGGRSTGHFGTGAYFFSDRESAEKYDDREVTAVDIRDYNLAPASRYLHDTLRKINGRVKYKKPHTFNAKEVEAVLDAIRFPGIQTPEILAQRRAQMPEAERAAKEATRLYNEPGNIDSASTSVMKALGYDGVYATPGSNMDNSTYGTVIYDVKAEPRAAEQQVVYRAGGLANKVEPRSEALSGRSTGHFGTGFYFFGKKSAAESNAESTNRPVTELDITEYNLAPASYFLHAALQEVNKRAMEDNREGRPHTITPQEIQYAQVAVEEGPSFGDFYYMNDALRIYKDQLISMDEAQRIAAEATRLYNEPGNVDSPSTSVMKALGYEGVNAVGTELDNYTYGTVVYDVKAEPKAAEQRVVEPGVADVLQRYEFKSNNSLKNAELADELRRNLKRFGYGVKQYGTRMNDFRVVSLDTGRAVDPNKLIAAELEDRRAVAEDQRIYREQQQARELEERIIEIYDADERPFTGRDFESNAAEQRSKIEAMSQPDDTMRDIVAKGREMGFRDSAIRAVLMKRYGRDSTEAINTALAENADIFTVIPKPFGNVVGGLDVGRQIYAEVRAKLNEFMRPKSPGRMTKQQRADRIAELRKAHPKQSKLSDSQLLRKFPRPKTTPTRAEMMAEALEILKANRRFKEQPEKVQKELLVGFATSLKSRANKGVQNLLSQIRRDLKERKKGAKTAREVQAQLRTLINEVLPKTDYSKADVAKLTKLINEVNEDNYIVKAQKVLDLVDRKREQIRKATIREIAAFVKRSAKTYKTPGGRIRTRGLDAPGQAFFLEAKRILTAVFKKDQTDIMNIGFNLANNPEVDIATAKLMNGESLTVKEQMLIDQKDAYDLFAPLANMSLEQVEAVLEDLKVTAGFSRLNLKNIRMERAARLNALRQGAKDSVEGNWGGVVTKEVEEDGETRIVAKDSNELATDRANKKSLKDILDAQGLQGKYRALVEWAKEGRRMTPMMFGLGDWWAHLGTLTSVFGEFFNENIYNKINRMKEENLRGEYAQKEKLNDIANSIDGITNGYEEITQLIFMGSGTRVLTADEQGLTLSVKAGRRKFTTDELMRVYALSKNPIQRAKLERQGFTDEVMADIEEFLDPRLTEFVDKTVEYLSNEYYEGINDVYVKVNDVNLGYMENYFPTRTQFQGDLATQSRDQLLSSTYSGPNSQMADALKERVDTGSDILMNEGIGFHGELGNHINTMERFKAYSVGVQEINAILSDSFTVSLSELLGLGKALNDGVSAAVMPDVFRSDLQFKYIDSLMSKMVGAALSFKPMQVVKQMTSAIAGVKEYQYGKEKNLPVDILMFSMDFVRLLPKLILEGVSLGKYKGPVSTMIEDSATLRRRIEDNFGGDLYGLTSGVSGRTRRVTARDYTLAAKALKGLSRFGGTATSSGDIAGVMGYLPAYMRDIQNGMSKEEAIEKFNQYNKTQQSRREAERAPIQTYQNGVSRLFTAFTSSQLLYLNEIVTTSNNMLKSIRKGEKIKASDSRGFALALVGYSVMFTLATNMWKLMFGDDEEKEKAWLDVGLSPVKNYFVIPVLGSYINDGYNWIVENNYPSQVAKDPLQSTIRDVKKAYKKEDYIRIGSEITEIGLGTNFDMFRGMMDIANGQPMDESFYDVMGVPPSQRPED